MTRTPEHIRKASAVRVGGLENRPVKRPGIPMTSNRSAAAVVFLLLISACSSPQPADNLPSATAIPPTAGTTRPLSTENGVDHIEPLVRWEHTTSRGDCLAARLDRTRFQVGECGLKGSIYPLDPDDRVELRRFLADYWSFKSITAAGSIEFDSSGYGGGKVPTPAEERMIATWIWLLAEEMHSGESPGWGLAFQWKEEANQDCRVLQVDKSAQASAFSCVEADWTLLGESRLEAHDLETFYTWVERFEPGTYDGVVLRTGGSTSPDADELLDLSLFAEGEYAMLVSLSPQARGETIIPFSQAAFLTFDSWSPGGEWIAYWSSSLDAVESYQGYGMPGGILHFANVISGEDCPVPEIVSESAYLAQVRWMAEDSAELRLDGYRYVGKPCQTTPFRRSPAQETLPSQEPAGLSPDGRFRAVTEEVTSDDHGWELNTSLIETATGRDVNRLEWRHRGGHGELELGGEWVSPSQFLIYETIDQGPLLLHVDGTSKSVLVEIIGLSSIPSLEADGYSLVALPNPSEREDDYNIAITGSGEEAKFPRVRLYHAETGLVEELPLTHLWGFAPSNDWILLYESKVSGGYETGSNLWARRVESAGGEWHLIAPVVDYILWNEPGDEMVFSQNETTLVWQSFPSLLEKGRWNTGPFSSYPASFSPDGRYALAIGNIPGKSAYGLFILEQ